MWNSNEDQIDRTFHMTLTLVRHGSTAGNQNGCYIGSTDEKLSPEGIEEIKGKNYPKADLIYSSPMIRCIQTARIIGGEKKIPVIIPDFREIDFGAFEGKNYRQLNENPVLKDKYQAFIDSNGLEPFPEGESREEFKGRSIAGFRQMIEDAAGKTWADLGGIFSRPKLLAVVHGGTIMAVLSVFAGGDYFDYQVGNGEGYQMDICLDNREISISNVRRIESV